ncbi:hypothetical protein DHW03_05670 [Pedobacter yonginense]|uniref:General secretion pathway protein GspM n=1 Tax=Pedobacter yonginense TaxID=651869 RepID=A0A317ERI6_9SPHI|nr:hypothetical protein [Pedobacter yonginense]PWS29304.1 hypothetical protein DHW03_05670 [Pedobacter yonginense]
MLIQKLDDKKRNILLWLAMLALVYIAYTCSFSNTLESIRLHNQLQNEQQSVDDTDSTLPQTLRENEFYETALKRYEVKKEDRETQIWQALSGITVAKGVKLSYSAEPQAETDTTAIKLHIFKQKFTLKGGYFELLATVDALHKTKNIGQISSLKLASKIENGAEEKQKDLTLQLEMTGIEF